MLYDFKKAQQKVLRNDILLNCFWLLTYGLAIQKCQVIVYWPLTEGETLGLNVHFWLAVRSFEGKHLKYMVGWFIRLHKISKCQDTNAKLYQKASSLNLFQYYKYAKYCECYEMDFHNIKDINAYYKMTQPVFKKSNSFFSRWMFWEMLSLLPYGNEAEQEKITEKILGANGVVWVYMDLNYCSQAHYSLTDHSQHVQTSLKQ